MLRALLRAVLPFAALAAGSWIGLDASAWPRVLDFAHARLEEAPKLAPQALGSVGAKVGVQIGFDRSPPPPGAFDPVAPLVDASKLPDPVPWPRLNADVSLTRAWLLAEGPRPEPGDGRRYVTFTFDDGPFPETTPYVLKTLAEHGVHATFFFIGRYLDGDDKRADATRAVARQVAAAGHMIGNHTHDHELLTTIARNQALAQIDEGEASIERVIGKRPIFFRPPYGQLDPFLQEHLKSRGAELVLWSIEAQDMKQGDADALAASLEQQLDYAGGGIVLLHDIRWSTVAALPKLLDWLHKRRFDPARPERPGYVVVDLPGYLRETAAHPQPYADRTTLEKARGVEWHKHHKQRHAPPRRTPTEGAPELTM